MYTKLYPHLKNEVDGGAAVEFHRGSVQLEFLPACYTFMYTLRPLFSKTMYTP